MNYYIYTTYILLCVCYIWSPIIKFNMMNKQIEEFDIWAETQSEQEPFLVTGYNEEKKEADGVEKSIADFHEHILKQLGQLQLIIEIFENYKIL